MSWQQVKETLTFKLPTFLAWVLTRPVAYLWDLDYKSIIWISLALTAYFYFTNNRIWTLISGLIFLLTFLRAEYERGEWVHWYRERFKKTAIEEAKREEEKKDEL